MSDIKQLKSKARESAKSLAKSLEILSKELDESEFENFLISEIFPSLIEDDAVYGISIWDKMELVKIVQMDSVLEEMGYSFEQAIHKMNTSAVCWLIDHIESTNRLLHMSGLQNGYSDPKDYRSTHDGVERDIEQLQEWLNQDIFERLQAYEHEIKNPRGLN